jgi:uncharacterized protein YdhG (YjbR/CyaY superfamily)
VLRETSSGGRRRRNLYPLFPSYLFFAGDELERLAVLRTERVVRLIEISEAEQARFRGEIAALETALVSAPESIELYPRLVPGAVVRISYRLPTFTLKGDLVYFGAFKNHIGLYPPVRDAELNALHDRRQREVIDARNQADALVYNVEKLLAEHSSRLNPSDAAAVETALAQTKAAMESGDLERIRSAVDMLNAASHQMSQTLYGQAQGGAGRQSYAAGQSAGCAGGTCGAGPGSPGRDDFVDAEWREAGGG